MLIQPRTCNALDVIQNLSTSDYLIAKNVADRTQTVFGLLQLKLLQTACHFFCYIQIIGITRTVFGLL
jgi:hypothetical protein